MKGRLDLDRCHRLDFQDNQLYHLEKLRKSIYIPVMARDWQDLIELTADQRIVVERVRLVEKDIAVEGVFELPQLARLDAADQVFVAAFVRSHGSIKEMERVFGVSYPTIKARLNRIAARLEFVDADPGPSQSDILERLRAGELSAEAAIAELEGLK
jgi:hypothetical protein